MKFAMETWILALSVFVLFLYGCKPAEIILHGDLTGFVTDAESLTPLENAAVYLNPADDSTTTSSDGKYLLKGLKPGNYELLASKSGYENSINNVNVGSAVTSAVDIHLTSIPLLIVSDTILIFEIDETELFITLSNPKPKKLKFIFEPSMSWITISPSSGELISDTVVIKVGLDMRGLTDKSMEDSIKLYSLYSSGSRDILLKIKSNMVKDIQNKYYKTVRIGNQIWMAENLRTTKYNNDTSVPLITERVYGKA